MPEENDNQEPTRETEVGIVRRSDLARRGMNAFNYVSGLSTRQKPYLQEVPTATEYSFEFLRKWGTEGSDDGQFNYPHDLALDRASNVYVVDWFNDRVQVFDHQGRFLRKWGTEGSGNGQFSYPIALALDEESNVYVVAVVLECARVQQFSRMIVLSKGYSRR